jgi:hypothetical protein
VPLLTECFGSTSHTCWESRSNECAEIASTPPSQT